MDKHLAKRPNVSMTIESRSVKDSGSILADQLQLATKMTGYEMNPTESRLWGCTFSKHPPQAIEWAFQQYWKEGKFFPKPADILSLVQQWKKAQREQEQEVAEQEETRELAQARERGETFGIVDIMPKFREIMQAQDKLAQGGIPTDAVAEKSPAKKIPEPLTEAQLKDRREILRQQAEAERKKRA